MIYEGFNPSKIELTKYLFFTGKGGVGKTSTACSTAVNLADLGKKILLISTDPASNLQDVFNTKLDNKGVIIDGVPNLKVINLNPIDAANEYKESVVAPYRGKLPDVVIENMEEQLSGSCTIEIASFNEFSNYITNNEIENLYDHIIFDTAPTGHTLRMLQLPSAWSEFIANSTHGASCLGQLAGLGEKKEIYKKAVDTLADKNKTTLIIVARPEESPIIEANRTSKELSLLGINNQLIIINGVINEFNDEVSKKIFLKQQEIINKMPETLEKYKIYRIPFRAYNVTGINNVRNFLEKDMLEISNEKIKNSNIKELKDVIDDLYNSNKKVIFTMGKGGVGKTTIASAIAIGLSNKGKKVHLTTTDPANHLNMVIKENKKIDISNIDEKEELIKYQKEVLTKAKEVMSEEDIKYIEEDLRSPCTQEIAVFRAFAEIVEKSEEEVIVIDTAPTGHTLLLLESTQNYSKEIIKKNGDVPESIIKLLPKLKDKNQTEVIIVTLPEATPVFEAKRLQEDLNRAEINNKWWIVNKSLYNVETENEILKVRASNEIKCINEVDEISNGNIALVNLKSEDIKEENLKIL